MPRVQFKITADDGKTVLLDKHTSAPHEFDFALAPEALAVVEGWMEGVGTTTTDPEGKTSFVPKYPNIAEVAREILFASFKQMIPPAAMAPFEEAKALVEKDKEALLWGFFGMEPPPNGPSRFSGNLRSPFRGTYSFTRQ